MKKHTAWPELELERSTEAPSLRRQIECQLAEAMQNGTLAAGLHLPSSRLLARLLQVSRGTVVDAYEALLEAGLVVATAGSGVRIAAHAPRVPNFINLRRTAAAAHYPTHVCRFEDCDGNGLYLNLSR